MLRVDINLVFTIINLLVLYLETGTFGEQTILDTYLQLRSSTDVLNDHRE